jgi:peptide/nickel transport system permease protein
MRFSQFLLTRLLSYFLVILIGITVVFFIPRLLPTSPIDMMLSRLTSQGINIPAEAIEEIRNTLLETYGMQGTLGEQYLGFLKRVILTGNFGPSLSFYPTPVSHLIKRALPWTLGLMLSSTLISWLIGNVIGLIAGYRPNKPLSRFLETAAMIVYPIPYYILALGLIILFAYIFPIFPFSFDVHMEPTLSWKMVKDIIYNSLLPALSMVIVSIGWWVISMKALASSVAEEDFVHYARLRGIPDNKIMGKYVARNAVLPQITMLALQLGGIFNGAMVTEMLFGYPGMGTLIYDAVIGSDYNLILGTISFSIVAVATTTLIVDLLYPFLDPRIRYR